MTIDVKERIKAFNIKHNKTIGERTKLEILQFLDFKKNKSVLTIDNLAFEYVQARQNLSFELLLQIKSTLTFLKERIISLLSEKKQLKICSLSLKLEKNNENIILAIALSKAKNSTNIFEFDNSYFNNDNFISFLEKRMTEGLKKGEVLDIFNLFLIKNNYLLNSIDALEEFNTNAE